MLSPLTKSGVTPGGGGDAARKPSCGELMPKESEMRLDECFWKERQPALWNLKPSPRRRGEQQAINQAPDARFPRFKARLLGDRSTTSQSHSPSNPTKGNKIDPSCEQKQLAMRKQGWHRRAWALADATTALQRIDHQIGEEAQGSVIAVRLVSWLNLLRRYHAEPGLHRDRRSGSGSPFPRRSAAIGA